MEREYTSALKAGRKQYRQSVSRGESPYLPILDDIIPENKAYSRVDLGLVQIPVEFIAGTKTAGRTTSFARNFMPIADEYSEFAQKWERLCASHLKEGIRDPVKVYEYMNRYYVEEGNKRVSVLKYFGAVTIAANVTRILPERDGSRKVEIYYEFTEFYKYSRINFIEFSKTGSYRKLLNYLGKGPKDIWTEEEGRHFVTVYYLFKKAYTDAGGEHLRSTVGDALLVFLDFYGYTSLDNVSRQDMQWMLFRIWKEIALQQEEEPLAVKLDPEEKKKKIIPSIRVLKKQKAAFLYRETPETLGWSNQHELGRRQVQKKFGDRIETISCMHVEKNSTEEAISAVIEQGATVVFATATEMNEGCLKAAVKFPEIPILNCSLNTPHRYIRTYYPRTYEAKFITGAIAGAICEEQKIGYVCKYPIYGNIAEINAFARGVQMVNPRAKVYLEWSSVNGGIGPTTEKLKSRGISLISFRDDVKRKKWEQPLFGLTYVKDGDILPMALPVWNWGRYYELILESILNGTFQSEDEKTNRSLNYYWGMSAGVVDMIYAERLPKGVRYMAEVLRKAVCTGICRPFYNPETEDGGRINWETMNHSLRVEDVINMDYLEENVVGAIPRYDELDEGSKEIVDITGIEQVKKDLR